MSMSLCTAGADNGTCDASCLCPGDETCKGNYNQSAAAPDLCCASLCPTVFLWGVHNSFVSIEQMQMRMLHLQKLTVHQGRNGNFREQKVLRAADCGLPKMLLRSCAALMTSKLNVQQSRHLHRNPRTASTVVVQVPTTISPATRSAALSMEHAPWTPPRPRRSPAAPQATSVAG